MRLALECPTSMLANVQPFADFDFVLAHKYQEDDNYKDYYQKSSRIKILDNSSNESGSPMSMEELEEIVQELRPEYVISPDWLHDGIKTAEAYVKSTEVFKASSVVGVLQGRTPLEAVDNAKYFSKTGILAVPYRVGGSTFDTPLEVMALRRALVVSGLPKETPIHLLGMTTLEELSWYTYRHNVVSIDTGMPVLLGLKGMDFDEAACKKGPTMNESEKLELTRDSWTSICRNVAFFRKFSGN